jgi:hypothetical protein
MPSRYGAFALLVASSSPGQAGWRFADARKEVSICREGVSDPPDQAYWDLMRKEDKICHWEDMLIGLLALT